MKTTTRARLLRIERRRGKRDYAAIWHLMPDETAEQATKRAERAGFVRVGLLLPLGLPQTDDAIAQWERAEAARNEATR